MNSWLADIRASIILTLILAVLCCGIYPLAVWGVAVIVFPEKAGGSLIHENGTIVGSRLIGQPFRAPGYFHPRPSAAGAGYDAMASGGSNLGPLSKRLLEDVGRRVGEYREQNGLAPGVPVPVDAVTASASGLDPHIGVDNARLQSVRVARARAVPPEEIQGLVARHTRERDWGLFGEPRVNVLELNLDLDRHFGKDGTP